jgi:hypothetical protein
MSVEYLRAVHIFRASLVQKEVHGKVDDEDPAEVFDRNYVQSPLIRERGRVRQALAPRSDGDTAPAAPQSPRAVWDALVAESQAQIEAIERDTLDIIAAISDADSSDLGDAESIHRDAQVRSTAPVYRATDCRHLCVLK